MNTKLKYLLYELEERIFPEFQYSRFLHAMLKSAYVFFYSLTFLPLYDWTRFWFTFPPYTQVLIDNVKLFVRTGTLKAKTVDLYMAVSCIIWKQYEQPGLLMNSETTVLDIGGHIGSFALWAGNQACRVIVFEPDQENFAILERNIKANGFENVTPVNKAVSGKTGEITLFRHKNNSARHSTMTHSADALKIASISLDDIFKHHKIEVCHFLKLDCEGAEFAILSETSQKTLEKIKRLSMEYHTGYDLADLLEKLKKAGFGIIKNECDSSYQGQVWAMRF